MKRNSIVLFLAVLPILGPRSARGQASAEAPRMTLELRADRSLALRWPAWANHFTVERSTTLGPGAVWQPMVTPTARAGDSLEARISPTEAAGYFRLVSRAVVPPEGTAFFLPDEPPTRGLEVEYDARGRMHFVYVRHSLVRDVQEVVYGTCDPDLDCDRASNWQTTVVHSGTIGTVQIEVTADGRPRLVLEDRYTVSSSRLAYMACESDCIRPESWAGIALLDRFRVGEAFALHLDQRWFATDRDGHARILVSDDAGAILLSCDRDCTTPSGDWTLTPLDTTGDPFLSSQLFAPVLRVDDTGRLHILGQNSLALVYLTAIGDFRRPENWRRTVLTDALHHGVRDSIPVSLGFASGFDLEIDGLGTPVAAFGGFVPATQEPRTYLFRLLPVGSESASWVGRPFPNTRADGLDLALAANGQPWFVLAGQVVQNGERIVQVATCETGNGYDFDAAWTARLVANSSTLEAERPVKRWPETPALCSIPTTSWEFPANRLLFHPSGTKRLVSNTAASSICQPGMDEWIDQWGTTRRGRTIDLWVIEARARWAVLP